MRLATKATHPQTRAINQGLVLRTIYDLGPISRADIARLTELTRTSVSELVGGSAPGEGRLLAIIGALFALSAAGAAMTLAGRRTARA